MKVFEVVYNAVNKKWDLPEFQRDFIWDAGQVRDLADSLYRNYPVGTFVIWTTEHYNEPKSARGTGPTQWIIDGQQRTTALCLLFGKKPYWWEESEEWNKAMKRYEIMFEIYSETDEPKFTIANNAIRKDPRWISIRDVLALEKIEQLSDLAEKKAKEISDNEEKRLKIQMKIFERLINLWKIKEREIPVININHTVDDVAEIFARLNQAGTRIKEADILLAYIAANNRGWVREEYLTYRNTLEERGWDLEAGIFIRTMTGIGLQKARLKEVEKTFWEGENLKRIWKLAKESIDEVLKRLLEKGLSTNELLPSNNSLIPLFVLHYKWKEASDYNWNKAFQWFLLANKDGRYSGSALESLQEDIKTIFSTQTFEEALERLMGKLKITQIQPEEFLGRYEIKANKFLRLMLYLILFEIGALDWVDKTRIGYDKSGNMALMGYQPQWHHIFPKSKLKKLGFATEEINALANMTVVNERTNSMHKLGGKYPWENIRKYNISNDLLKQHYVPPIIYQIKNEEDVKLRYKEFLQQRAELLAEATNDYLQKLGES